MEWFTKQEFPRCLEQLKNACDWYTNSEQDNLKQSVPVCNWGKTATAALSHAENFWLTIGKDFTQNYHVTKFYYGNGKIFLLNKNINSIIIRSFPTRHLPLVISQSTVTEKHLNTSKLQT